MSKNDVNLNSNILPNGCPFCVQMCMNAHCPYDNAKTEPKKFDKVIKAINELIFGKKNVSLKDKEC